MDKSKEKGEDRGKDSGSANPDLTPYGSLTLDEVKAKVEEATSGVTSSFIKSSGPEITAIPDDDDILEEIKEYHLDIQSLFTVLPTAIYLVKLANDRRSRGKLDRALDALGVPPLITVGLTHVIVPTERQAFYDALSG